MAIMTAASVSALVAQFYPLTFPDNIWVLGVCVVIYFALSGVLQFMVTFMEKDFIYGSSPIGGCGNVVLRSSLPKGSQWYTLTAEFPKGTQVGKLVRSVGEYYRKSGFLVPESVERDIKSVLCGPWRAALAALQVPPLPPDFPSEVNARDSFTAWLCFFKPRLETALSQVGIRPHSSLMAGAWDAACSPALLDKVYSAWEDYTMETFKGRSSGLSAYGGRFREEAVRIMGVKASEEYCAAAQVKDSKETPKVGGAAPWEAAFSSILSTLKVKGGYGPEGECLRFKELVGAAKQLDPRLSNKVSHHKSEATAEKSNPSLQESKKNT